MALEELKVKMSEAVKVFQASGDMSKIQEVTNEMNKAKAAIAKEQAEALLKESEVLAGKREELATRIHQTLRTDLSGLMGELAKVKAWGFTYKVDKAVPGAEDVSYKSVGLSIQVVKARKSGGTGTGRRGGLQEDFEKVKQFYPEADAELAEALEKDKTVTNQGYSYNVKKKFQKKGIADGHLQPTK